MTTRSAGIRAIAETEIVATMLRVLCDATGMQFAAVVRVDDVQWVACAMHDELNFGVKPGGNLDFISALCGVEQDSRAPIVVDKAGGTGRFCSYCRGTASKRCEIESYISVPIVMPDGAYFGTLFAFNTAVTAIANPRIVPMFNQFAALIAHQLANDSVRRAEHLALLDERAAGNSREHFVAILGHDLRNPLQAVMACSEMLLRKTQDPALLSLASRIKTSGHRMSVLIDDVLDFTRVRLGDGIVCQLQDVDNIQNGLTSVVKELQEAQPRRTINADINVAKQVRCDMGRVQQLVSNLIGNALAHGAKDGPISFTASEDEQNLILQVWNDGDPIPAESIGKIFGPFWRHSNGSDHHGLGLGLHICSEIVRAHRGTISVTSDAERGTLFTAKFPLGAAQRPALGTAHEGAERLAG